MVNSHYTWQTPTAQCTSLDQPEHAAVNAIARRLYGLLPLDSACRHTLRSGSSPFAVADAESLCTEAVLALGVSIRFPGLLWNS
jgi:hypothetical protein